jgi:hypothetical protein
LQDYGEALCTEPAYFPEARVASLFSRDTVRCSIREHAGSGFIFWSNYQRLVDLPPVQGVQLHLATKEGPVDIPENPVSFEANSYEIWPYDLQLGGATLRYATAQPLCILHNPTLTTYVFFSSHASEFVFDAGSAVDPLVNAAVTKGLKKMYVTCPADSIAAFSILSKGGRWIRVLVLPRGLALQATKFHHGAKDFLVLSHENVLIAGERLILEKVGGTPEATWSVYPNLGWKTTADAGMVEHRESPLFTHYRVSIRTAPPLQKVSVDLLPACQAGARNYQDSILRWYAKSKHFNSRQPGPVYQYSFHHLPAEHVYGLHFNVPKAPLVKDWEADVVYQGDVLALYRGGRLVYDQFNSDDTCAFRLSYVTTGPADSLLAQVLPLPRDYDIYVEDPVKEERLNDWPKARIRSVTLNPVYWFELRPKN